MRGKIEKMGGERRREVKRGKKKDGERKRGD